MPQGGLQVNGRIERRSRVMDGGPCAADHRRGPKAGKTLHFFSQKWSKVDGQKVAVHGPVFFT